MCRTLNATNMRFAWRTTVHCVLWTCASVNNALVLPWSDWSPWTCQRLAVSKVWSCSARSVTVHCEPRLFEAWRNRERNVCLLVAVCGNYTACRSIAKINCGVVLTRISFLRSLRCISHKIRPFIDRRKYAAFRLTVSASFGGRQGEL